MLLILIIFGGGLALSVPLIRLLRRQIRQEREERERQRNGVPSAPPQLEEEAEEGADCDPEPTKPTTLLNPAGVLLVLLPLGLSMVNHYEKGKTIDDAFFLHIGLVTLAIWMVLVAALKDGFPFRGVSRRRSLAVLMVFAGLSVSTTVFSGASLLNRTGEQSGQRLESVIDRKWEEASDPTSYHVSFTMPLQPPKRGSAQVSQAEYEQVVAGSNRVHYRLYPGRLGYRWVSNPCILPETGKP